MFNRGWQGLQRFQRQRLSISDTATPVPDMSREVIADFLLLLEQLVIAQNKEGEERAVFVYRGYVGNRAIQLARFELSIFTERKDIREVEWTDRIER